MKSKLVTMLATLLPGCVAAPAYVRPDLALSATYHGSAGIDAQASEVDWWASFDDPLLARLVKEAVAGNDDLAQARARIDQSRALAASSGAALLPTVDAVGDVTSVRQSGRTAIGRVTNALGVGRGYTEYAAGVRASWELDLFGGRRREREAALSDLAASEASAGAVALAVAAETADAYISLRGLQARRAVVDDQVRTEAALATLVGSRFAEGVASERELNRARADLEGVRSAAPSLRTAIEASLNRIDVLLGRPPGAGRELLVGVRPIPKAPMPAGSAAPADLLRRRPDVVAAERRLAASSSRVAAAMGAYYPRVSLSGLLGLASLGLDGLVSGSAVQASGGAGLRWRLFDFGRVDAEVAAARGREAEALAAWRSVALSAAADVEDALVRLEQARSQREILRRQVAALTRARAQAHDAYVGGAVSLIEVSEADRDLLGAASSLVDTGTEEARAAIAAYRALGGGWRRPPTEEVASAAPGPS